MCVSFNTAQEKYMTDSIMQLALTACKMAGSTNEVNLVTSSYSLESVTEDPAAFTRNVLL